MFGALTDTCEMHGERMPFVSSWWTQLSEATRRSVKEAILTHDACFANEIVIM